jgi:glutaminyl-tRNA synthetase
LSYSRFNLSNTVLSKRKIERLIAEKLVTFGYDPRRMNTIQGLKCRGHTLSILKTFSEAIGLANRGTENINSYKKLESVLKNL